MADNGGVSPGRLGLTLDVDWAPDFMIDDVRSLLVEGNVKATWFVTHGSPAVSRLAERPDLFEIGWHPNFFPQSTQGGTRSEIYSFLEKIAPRARGVRTHGLYQSTALLMSWIEEERFFYDASLFLPGQDGLSPFLFSHRGKSLWRVSYNWEDDYTMGLVRPTWDFSDRLTRPGWQIHNFHPVHVYLNSNTPKVYEKLKKEFPSLQKASLAACRSMRRDEPGTRSFFIDLINHLSRTGTSSTLGKMVKDFSLEKRRERFDKGLSKEDKSE